MKIPEFPLGVRGECRFGGLSRKLMIPEGEVFYNKLDLVGIVVQHLLEQRLKAGAVGSLIVVKDGDDDGCIRRPFKGETGYVDIVDAVHTNNLEGV